MSGYSASEVGRLLGLSAGQVRSYVRSGFLSPAPGPSGDMRFSFQDVVLLRTAKGMVEARIPPRRVRRLLKKLKDQLPNGRPLTGLSISTEGRKVVVRDGSARWDPEDGQCLLDFEVADLARKAEPIILRAARVARQTEKEQSAEDWYDLGCNLEVCSPEEARDAYRRAVELEPFHPDAHVNLGRLLHEAGKLAAAEAHYRLALTAKGDFLEAAFNLGVVLEDLGRADEAIAAYEQAIVADPSCADAHFNVARLCEKAGKTAAAIRHLKAYRNLTEGH